MMATRRSVLTIGLLCAMGVVFGAGASGGARADETAITCPAPGTPAGQGASDAAATPATSDADFPEDGGTLTVFAAASLTDAFAAMKASLESAHPGLAITYNFAGSQTLVTQLKEGAPADVFASANDAQMQVAIADGSISGEPVTFARNRLAIVTPRDNPAEIASAADLAKPGVRLVLAQAEVPAGRYAREAICTMSAQHGPEFAGLVGGNIVSDEEDVRAVLAKVQLGEADAGIVYVSDAASAGDGVRRVEIPDAANVAATYPIAAVRGGDQTLAAAFIAYVLGPDGQATLADNGFEPVD